MYRCVNGSNCKNLICKLDSQLSENAADNDGPVPVNQIFNYSITPFIPGISFVEHKVHRNRYRQCNKHCNGSRHHESVKAVKPFSMLCDSYDYSQHDTGNGVCSRNTVDGAVCKVSRKSDHHAAHRARNICT